MKRSNKPLPEVDIISYGQYTPWNREEKYLPELVKLTDTIEAELGIEFGMIVEIRQGKGRYLEYEIDHPPFRDEQGNIAPSFTGEYQVRSNPAWFFLGDTVWQPLEDKKGEWKLKIFIENKLMAQKSLSLK